jgi:hypothetical protein
MSPPADTDTAVAYLSDANPFAGCSSFDDFLPKAQALVGDVTPDHVETLRGYFETCGDRLGREPMRAPVRTISGLRRVSPGPFAEAEMRSGGHPPSLLRSFGGTTSTCK